MAQQTINVGAAPDDGTGDPARTAFTKCNANFTELYTADTAFLTTTVAATTYQPLDADLTAIAALTGTNTIYYRSAANTWAAVTVSTGLSFTGGILTATGGGGTAVTVNVQTFTASGTYTPISGMRYCTIECVGGGGGGGGIQAASSEMAGGGGGGSGGYSRKTVDAATIGASKPVTIGVAGTAGTSGGGTGGSGGQTSVGTLCVANGGTGGGGFTGTTGTLVGGLGGNLTGAVGDITAAGAPGNPGYYFADVTMRLSGADGGSSVFGGAGRGATWSSTSAVGGAASNYGSGGGGAQNTNAGTARAGGAGSAGYVIITEYL